MPDDVVMAMSLFLTMGWFDQASTPAEKRCINLRLEDVEVSGWLSLSCTIWWRLTYFGTLSFVDGSVKSVRSIVADSHRSFEEVRQYRFIVERLMF